MMNIKSLTIIAFLSASALYLSSCQKEFSRFREGDAVRFSVGSAGTKATYSGEAGSGTGINWQVNDTLRIYCAAVSEPECKYADYRVSSVESTPSKARISGLGGVGLRWSTGDHTFYAVYPSPAVNGITRGISGKDVTANLPAVQRVKDLSTSGISQTAAPDLKNMLMTAMTTYTEATMPGDGTVFLNFTPLTTAIQFTVTNQTKADLEIKSVSLTSASSPLNGPFTVDISDSSTPDAVDTDGDGTSDITYNYSYPACQYTGTFSDASRTVTINFDSPVQLAYDEDVAKCGTLTFTFFLQPCKHFDDLTFKFVKSDGSTLSTRIGYLDGTGVRFPRFMKSYVTGLFIPEGAQWTVKYGPLVTSWDTETGINEALELKPNIVPPPYVLPEVFSVSASKKVYFSKGNLYYDGSNGRFESNQYDYRTYAGSYSRNNGVLSANGTPAGNWGLFGWSSTDHHYGMSTAITDLDYSGNIFYDWSNLFSSGEWFTLSSDEWSYLLFTRTVHGGTGSGHSFMATTVTLENNQTVSGFMIAPDNYSSDLTATYSWTEYRAAESAGCMFLPFAGVREGTNVTGPGDVGFYWSATKHDDNRAYCIVFESTPTVSTEVYRYRGCCVRLVTLAK